MYGLPGHLGFIVFTPPFPALSHTFLWTLQGGGELQSELVCIDLNLNLSFELCGVMVRSPLICTWEILLVCLLLPQSFLFSCYSGA